MDVEQNFAIPVIQPNRKSDMPGLEIKDNLKPESIVEPECAEHGAASEGSIECVESEY